MPESWCTCCDPHLEGRGEGLDYGLQAWERIQLGGRVEMEASGQQSDVDVYMGKRQEYQVPSQRPWKRHPSW